MEWIENIFMSKAGAFIIMAFVVFLFIGLLRLLYGPKGIWRKNLWDTTYNDMHENISNKEQKDILHDEQKNICKKK